MLAYNNEIKKISAELLENNTVDMILGFRQGSVPMINEPCLINKPEESSLLVWDSNCRINLANYLINLEGKIGIIAKGCDSRNIVIHIIENKVKRAQLYIIGIPCKGMIDRKKIKKYISNEIINIEEKEETITVKTIENLKTVIDKKKVLQDNCLFCSYPNPIISDVIIGNKIEINNRNLDNFSDVKKIEKMNSEEKWDYFDKLFSPCIRCYACKDSCPLCYCPTCFIDESDPQWLDKSINSNNIKVFHFLRAYHCAGRCTDCGACEQVCPVGINMRILTRKLIIDCKKEFNWEAGLSNETRPPLDRYSINDSEKFIK